eukprot:COSAG02_NODE_568_length_20207_cov_50.273374_6_plen_880_part_00
MPWSFPRVFLRAFWLTELHASRQVCDLIEPVVGRVIVVTIRVEEGSGGRSLIFASLADPQMVDAAEQAKLAIMDEDGTEVPLELHRASVDDELSQVRTVRLRGEAGSFCPPSNTVVCTVPNGGLGVSDNRKLAEIFVDVLTDSEEAPEGAAVVAVVTVNRPGSRTSNAQIVLNSPAAVDYTQQLTIMFWDPATNKDLLLKTHPLVPAGDKSPQTQYVDMSPRAVVAESSVLISREVEDQANNLWEEASTRQAALALEWWNRVQNLDEDEIQMRREEKEAREAEEAALKEEREAQVAEAEAEAKEEAAWLAAEQMRREEEEAEDALRRAHEEELEAIEAIKLAEKEEEEANVAQALAKELQTRAREAQEVAAKEAAEAEEARKNADKEVQEAEEAEAAALKEEEEANAAIAAVSTAEAEARSLYMKADVPWGTVEDVEQEVLDAEAALQAAGKNGKKHDKAQLFLEKVQLRCEKRKQLEELKVQARREVQEAEEARAKATKEREEAFAAKRDAAIEASEAEDAAEIAAAELKKANDAMQAASFERAEAIQAKRNAEREIEEAAQAKRDALREMQEFEASRAKAKAERDSANEAREVAIKERAEADEATAKAIKERSEADAARSKWAQKQAAKKGLKWKRKTTSVGTSVKRGSKSRTSNASGSGQKSTSRQPKPPKFGKTRLWSASGRRPLTSTVNFGNTEAYAAVDSGRTHTKIVVGLDCALVPTGDAEEAARAALAAQTARARVDRRAGASLETDSAAQVAELEAVAGQHGGGVLKAALTPRSLVSQIIYQDAWFNRHKNTGANGNWQGVSHTARARLQTPGTNTLLPELSPRYKTMMDSRREEVLASAQNTLSLPINMRLPQLSAGEQAPSWLQSDFW